MKPKMKTIHLRGLLWLYLYGFGYMSLALEPGQFLDFDNLPDTNFTCVGKVIGGYYADLETNCQMFHVCTIGQLDEPMDIRFLCLNGTVFDQETRVCERIDEVDCSKSEKFYSLNLELYGNTQPPILEESPETDLPIIIKASSSTTTTTTTTSTTTSTTTKPPIKHYSTTRPPIVTTITNPKVVSVHHFPLSNPPDIRFNPSEINISLNPGAPPSIKKSPRPGDQLKKPVVITTTTQHPKTIVSYDLTHDNRQQNPVTPSEINYSFTYRNDDSDELYHDTETPQHYHYRSNYANYNTELYRLRTTTPNLPSSTTQKLSATTYRNPFATILKSASYHQYNTEKPQNLQLPLPTLPPLTFSSPAPFSLTKHSETKRYTNEQQPRIIISASASVSDASGRRLNYSLGTIGLTPALLEETSMKFDDEYYKDHHLETFFHDVPKLKQPQQRKKRNADDKETTTRTVIKSEQEAVDILKFLFDWYQQKNKSTISIPVKPDDITVINQQLIGVDMETETNSTETDAYNLRNNNLFKRGSKFNIIGDILSITEQPTTEIITETTENYQDDQDYEYIDDNYEPDTYRTGTLDYENFSTEATTTENNLENSTTENSEEQTTSITEDFNTTETTTENSITTSTKNWEETENFETTTTPETVEEQTTETPIETTTENLTTTTTTTTTRRNLQKGRNLNRYTSRKPQRGSSGRFSPYHRFSTGSRTTFSYNTYLTTTTTTTTERPATEQTDYSPYHRFSTKSRPTFSYNTDVTTTTTTERPATEQTDYSPYHRFSTESRPTFSYNTDITTTTTTITERPTTERTDYIEDVPLTEPPLDRSANPTQSETIKQIELNTTPLSSTSFDKIIVNRNKSNKTFIFNCFGKPVNKFYSDPRDCRLFHYCTQGYTKNQLLDMKFVCDLGTYFDDEKLICTKIKPARCLS